MEARREGDRRQGSHCPEETPGEFRSPDGGSLERTRNSHSCGTNSGRGSVSYTLPVPMSPSPLKRAA